MYVCMRDSVCVCLCSGVYRFVNRVKCAFLWRYTAPYPLQTVTVRNVNIIQWENEDIFPEHFQNT